MFNIDKTQEESGEMLNETKISIAIYNTYFS